MKIILLPVIFLFCIAGVHAQTYYYNTTKTFYENGYTYQCDVPESKMVTLYNNTNKLTYTDVAYKASGQVYFPQSINDPEIYEEGTWVESKYTSIVNNAFTATEKQRLKGHKLGITMYISSDTGKVIEVRFRFTTNNPFATIPVSVYWNIETQLKKDIWFTSTAEGKKLNHMICNWRQEVK